jgi:HSP20 family molecular chaperone IbpA
MFEDFGRDWRAPFGALSRDIGRGLGEVQPPAVDITETADGFELSAELPGMDEKNIDLKLAGGRLIIRGEKKDEREEKTGETYLRERRFGSFERVFTLPDDVDAGRIEARFDNGILKVSHYINLILFEGESFGKKAVVRGSLERLTPVLMTALAAGLALLPLIVGADEPGREILHPVAVTIFGGLISATLLDTLLTPVLFLKYGKPAVERLAAARASNLQPAEAY